MELDAAAAKKMQQDAIRARSTRDIIIVEEGIEKAAKKGNTSVAMHDLSEEVKSVLVKRGFGIKDQKSFFYGNRTITLISW